MDLTLNEFNNLPSSFKKVINPTEKQLKYPECFIKETCHIKRFTKDKIYSEKNKTICNNCIWN